MMNAQNNKRKSTVRAAIRTGFLSGAVNVIAVLLGLTGLVGTIVQGWFDLRSLYLGAWVLLAGVALWGGATAVRHVESGSFGQAAIAGLLTGAVHGVAMALFTWRVGSLIDSGVALRKWLAQLTPQAVELLTFGLFPATAAAVVFAILTVGGLTGALLAYASARYKWRRSLSERWRAMREKVDAVPAVRRLRQHRYSRQMWYGAGLLALLVAPLVLGKYWNYTLGTVGIYVMLGLGLNIVVGMAGLLDLGYAAFFAIGAYTIALLTAPEPHAIQADFWLVLPLSVLLASSAGVLLGIPVLRMRGDYLAIVTLGFGEIIRVLLKSDTLTAFTGGPQGVRDIGGPSIFGVQADDRIYVYFIILGIALVAFATHRLQRSRVGRAWMAMREDEDVAETMGVYTLKYKLLAFAIGAGFAGFGGAIFAARNQYANPEDFALLASVNVLSLVIIGGMGSIPGIVLGALVLKGLPEILRQLEDYRMLAFGVLLIVMMILRPEGLWPSKRRAMELRESTE
jgi:branched-chain amino acid transport system permease protein